MSVTATANYGFTKEQLGHPPRDTTLGENLDAIDTALKVVDDAQALKKGVCVLGDIDITEATVWKTEFPFKVTIDKVNTVVSVALSANETTITLKNNGGTAMTGGVITIASAAPKGAIDTASPTVHNVIDAGEDIQLVSSGACSTGKVIVTIHYTRTA